MSINSQSYTRFNVNSSSTNGSSWNISSRVYNFKNLPEPKNATKAYHSIQFDLQDGLIIED
ncbi:hypothetical protein C1646_760543 [Rhizophagus diaphanus]|nr:hypothetical protein C1646_760543 [Rhizophagus diaphanus] [Rhizophagus sp. MUCL 43196]